jgi:hypothetical protein
MMSSVANLYGYQAMPWIYMDVAMQRYGVLGSGGDGISVDVVPFGHKQIIMGHEYRVFLLSF